MKKKFLGRVLTMLLVASMVFTLLPAPAIAAGNWWWNNDEYTEEAVPTATTTADNYYKIVHLDCGRKYFTELEIREIIDAMYLNGFNQLQLAFGNGGLRFILDDMTLKNATGEVLYNSNDVVTAIQDGNDTYDRTYNYAPGEKEELTETEMDSIISYANEKGIEIVPLLNLPGHMEGILSSSKFSNFKLADETAYPYSLDLNNQNAIAFGEALLRRYVTYFASKGCRYFNFGADEYGLSIYNPYFEYANRKVSYDSMLNFMNSCVGIITSEKTPDGTSLTARCFNDFVYYNKKAGVNKNIEVCYWSNQWSNAQYQDAETLVSQGYKLINTNQNWYYVPGQKTGYKYSTALAGINNYDTNHFRNIGGDGVEIKGASNIGAMFCVWCDDPAADLNMGEIEGLIAAMAKKNNFQTVPQPEPTEPTTKKINITVGQRHTETINGNHPGPYEIAKPDIATVTGKVIPGTATTPTLGEKYTLQSYSHGTSKTGVIADKSRNYLKVDNATITNTTNIAEATEFNVTIKGKYFGAKYAVIQVKNSTDNRYLGFDAQTPPTLWVNNYSSDWVVGTGHDFSINNYCLAYTNGEWQLSYGDWDYGGCLYEVKTDTTSTADKTELTFTGVTPGDTEVTIGTTKYLIHVSEAQLSDNRICINYYITSNKVEDKNGNTSRWVSADEGNINSEKGVAIEELIALTGTDTHTGKPTKFYKATAQSGNNIQTDAGWTNKIDAGFNCAKLRYWNNTWSVCDANGQWHEVSGKTAEFNPQTQLNSGAAETNTGYAAITAYYGQKTEVTDEITTYATDWGEDITTSYDNKGISGLGDTYALLDFAVKYQTGDRTPTSFTNAKTIVYNGVGSDDYHYSQDGNTRIVKDLFVENTDGYEVYMITVTKCSEKLTTDARNLYALPAVTYAEENEKVVWVDKEADLGDFAPTDKHYPGYKEGGEPIVPAVYVAKSNAYLVTYYVRAVSKDQLQVNYIDLATGKQFYHYGINVRGTTTFSEDIALNKDTPESWKGNLVNGTVTNDKNKNQTVSADLSTMPEIGAEYRHVAYTCNHIQLSADRKTLNLYYTFNNTVTFVADFGLPITINKGDLSKTLTNAGVEITEVKAAGVNHGAVEINEDVVTYTPDKRFVADENGESFTLTYTGTNVQETGSEGKVAYRVNILPASNVLYEENFLTEAPAANGRSWTKGTTVAPTTPQQTQKVNGTGSYNVFGRDAAYDAVTGELGVWTATGLVAGEGTTKYLSTEFYGNGFDLIGNCGPDTGRVFLFISGANQIKLVDVDTRYRGSTLNRVPLAHVMLGQEANYQVKVSAAGLKATDATSASYSLSGAATYASDYAVGGYDADLYNVLAENGLTMADVEYVKVESASAATTRSAASFYALDTADVGGTVTRPAGTHVEIDGFRVYRSTTNANYPTSEQNLKYVNVLDAVTFKDGNVAYTELNGAHKLVSRKDYESNGGPQNEIYLMNGQSVVFNLGSDMAGKTVQITARAVTGTAAMLNTTSISSNTEMYYEVKVGESGTLAIHNSGEGMLAIANLKVPNTVTFNPVTAETLAIAERMLLAYAGASDESNAFDPAISAKVTTTRFIRSKVVTLTVSASSDVAVLKVNGVELRPTNSWLVKMGWSDTYTYILTEKVPKNEIKTYEIVGYRADGAASAPTVVKSK